MNPAPSDVGSLDVAYRAVAEACVLTAIHLGPPADHGGRPNRDAGPSCPAIDQAIDHQATMLERRYGGPVRRTVAALWALHRHLLVTGLLLTGPYLLHRCVPRIPPGGITLDPAASTATVIVAGLTGASETGPHDQEPHDQEPDDQEPHDQEPWHLQELRAALARHCAPLVTAYRPHARGGERSLWGAATDQVAGGLWHLGRELNREAEATVISGALLPGDTRPFVGGAAFRPTTSHADGSGSGRDQPSAMTRTRVRCCLLYTVSPADVCATCPRRQPPA
ncbi:MAG: (2Fe-2S)-binding protein [Frankia sp.]